MKSAASPQVSRTCPVAVRVLRCHPVTEEYDAVLAGLQRRGFRLELSADDESVERVTSPGGNTLDHPSLDELRHLLRGISIRSPTELFKTQGLGSCSATWWVGFSSLLRKIATS